MQDANWTNESFMEDNRGKLAVFFHSKQVQNNFKTMTEKRPIFEEKVFLKKLVATNTKQDKLPVETTILSLMMMVLVTKIMVARFGRPMTTMTTLVEKRKKSANSAKVNKQ